MNNRIIGMLFFLLSNISVFYANAADVIIMRKGYGLIYWGDKSSTYNPSVYPLKGSYAYEELLQWKSDGTTADLHPQYVISDEENRQLKKMFAIDATLRVRQQKYNVFATVTFHNKSNHTYFISRGRMPADEWGGGFGVMCGSAFRITSEDIKLDYLGHSCDFGRDRLNGWAEIKRGEVFSFAVPINLAYEFLPGKHQYQIGSLEYKVVTKQWFTEVEAYDAMFGILNFRAACPIKTDLPLVTERWFMCPQYEFGKGDLESILDDFGFDRNHSKYSFKIRTNQVSVTINADKQTSYYHFFRNH
ncbi:MULTISPECIES: transposase [Enterobacterales]|uniref:transposase n=1 Tax=Enterobacterales TaxID=91347 RepID=UPI002EDB0BB5